TDKTVAELTANIGLGNATNSFGDLVSVNAKDLTIAAAGNLNFGNVLTSGNFNATAGNNLDLGVASVGGNLVAISIGGSVTTADTVHVTGASSFSAPSGMVIGLFDGLPTGGVPPSAPTPLPEAITGSAPIQPPAIPVLNTVISAHGTDSASGSTDASGITTRGAATSGGFTEAKTLGIAEPVSAIFVYSIPESTFSHSDLKAVIALDVRMFDGSLLPEWLTFDPVRKMLIGTAPKGVHGEFKIRITAKDQFGGEAFSVLTVKISNK
ncbi:MAG: putative Ig domain-containing protein, partial [Desulfuromonadales bacterium]